MVILIILAGAFIIISLFSVDFLRRRGCSNRAITALALFNAVIAIFIMVSPYLNI